MLLPQILVNRPPDVGKAHAMEDVLVVFGGKIAVGETGVVLGISTLRGAETQVLCGGVLIKALCQQID